LLASSPYSNAGEILSQGASETPPRAFAAAKVQGVLRLRMIGFSPITLRSG
jgi:hypothetical protein